MGRREMTEAMKLMWTEKHYKVNERRMALEKKILSLDRQTIKHYTSERRGEAEERSKLLGILAALEKRLNFKQITVLFA